MSDSSNVVLANVTLYSACGMGLYCQHCTNALLSGMRVLKRPGRPMSITADAAHFTACAGTIEIEGSLFEGQGNG